MISPQNPNCAEHPDAPLQVPRGVALPLVSEHDDQADATRRSAVRRLWQGGHMLDELIVAVGAAGWAALLVAPLRHRFCWVLARSCAVALAAGWIGLAVWSGTDAVVPQLGLASLAAALEGDPAARQQAILQMQAFSLFLGSWQVEDSTRHAISHRWLAPCLILTALAGPLGLVVHIGLRDVRKWQLSRLATGPE